MKILETAERSSIDIPLSELLHGSGKLKIRPDLIGKGLVELRQAKNALTLRVNGLVGRLPVTDNLLLDVHPKFPVSNLNRMVHASRTELKNPFFVDRPYQRYKTQDYLPIPLIRSLTRMLSELITRGVFREYLRETTIGSPRPKINFIKSHQKFWAKHDPTKAVMEQFTYSADNLPNQCLKLATVKALALSKTTDQLKACVPTLAESLRQLERVSFKSQQAINCELPYVRSRVPSFRSDYARALAVALEIIQHSDVSLNSAQSGISLEAFIISLDDVFERYIRNVVSSILRPDGSSIKTVDGNLKQHQKYLFHDNSKYKIKPDLIIKDASSILMIGDVKYKVKPQEVDRYQIITHALSYDVNRVVLIYPSRARYGERGLRRLGRAGKAGNHIVVYEYYFDLAENLEFEEEALRTAVLKIIASCASDLPT